MSSVTELQCSRAGCLNIRQPGEEWCQHHIMQARRASGLCANCGGERVREPVMNELTGRQLQRKGEPAWQLRCLGCGRVQNWGG